MSSSGHLVLLPRLLGWPYEDLEPRARKSFEVALHAGTALALALALRDEVRDEARRLDGRRAVHALLAFVPPAATGLRFGSAVEERLGSVRGVAVAQIAAGLALAAADRRPERRGRESAGFADHLALGLAQATALAPGVSRGGATITVARLRGLTRRASNRLSRQVAGPIMMGAGALETARLVRSGLPAGLHAPFAAGAAASFASSFVSSRLAQAMEGVGSFYPFAAYRVALGVGTLVWLRTATRRSERP